MARIVREVRIAVSPEILWDAVRDLGALHTRLVPGFVVDTQLEPGARRVRFANGMEALERIVAVEDAQRCLVWSASGGALAHHNASFQVHADGEGGSRGVWTADLLPDAMAPAIAAMIESGLAAMKRAQERDREAARERESA